MNPLSALLRNVADTIDSINTRVDERRQDPDAPLVDFPAVNEALVTLGASTISAVLDLVESFPRPGFQRDCANSDSSDSSMDPTKVEEEVDKVIGRMGLVQEDELAALRKRVAELEQKLAHP